MNPPQIDRGPEGPLAATPALEALLGRLRQRLTLQVWAHGLGTTATAIAGWLVFAFLADWGLSVPHAVRLFHSLVLVGVFGFFVWRDLVAPLRRLPRRGELALLIERQHPELHELLVSAVQLQSARPEEAHPDLVKRILADADQHARELRARELVDRRKPGLRFASGLLCAGVFSLVLALRPDHGAIFLDRMLGGTRPWPQRTHLFVEMPLPGRRVQTRPGQEEVTVQVARGSDLSVRVVAAGVVPDEVTLHIEDGEELLLGASSDRSFRTLLPALREDLSFYVTGGDDRDRLPRVHVQVLQPPDVTGVAVHIDPPIYTGRAPQIAFDRDVEVVAGSRLRIHVRTDPVQVDGVARLLPEDRLVELERADYPDPDGSTNAETDRGAGTTGFAFDFVADASARFRFELEDEKGLSNPDPGLFAIDVVPDREPQLQVVSPSASRVYSVPGGAISVRARVEDDFGLTELMLRVQRPDLTSAETAPPLVEQAMTLEPLDAAADPAGAATGATSSTAPIRRATAVRRLEVDDLAAEGVAVTPGESFEIELTARDNRAPEAQLGRSATRTLLVISIDELLRKVQDQLARARRDASELVDLQREKRARVEELLQALQSETPLAGGDSQVLLSALAGQRRVAGDANALVRELAAVAEAVLYARLDDQAEPLLQELDQRLAAGADASFQAGAWRALVAAHQTGLASGAGFAGQLVEMVGAALVVAEDHASAATAGLDRAQAASDAADVFEALLAASEAQDRTLVALEHLLERLAEWDNFQSVLALTRDILGSQKALREQTRKFAADK